MAEPNEVVNIITQVGFPIVCVFLAIVCFKWIFTQLREIQENQTNKITELQEKQDAALDNVKDALNNNTAVIQNLRAIIETIVHTRKDLSNED